jgi:predicted nucleic acid-binding protein
VLVEFVAVVTHPRIYNPPTPLPTALEEVQALLASPSGRVLVESDGSWATFSRIAAAAGATGARLHDARIAALCLDAGVREYLSVDRDLSRFPELRVRNPLSPRRG